MAFIGLDNLISKKVLMDDIGTAKGCEMSCDDCEKINCLTGTVIDKQPIIEAEPVRHGQWIEKKQPRGGIFDYCFVCSECHKKTPDGAFVISPDYCPFCGAKMDLEE